MEDSGSFIRGLISAVPGRGSDKNIWSGREISQASSSIGNCISGLRRSDYPLVSPEENSPSDSEILELSLNQVEVYSESKLKVPKILHERNSPLARNKYDFETQGEDKDSSSINGNWTNDYGCSSQTEESSVDSEMHYHLTHSEEGNSSTSDDDGGDYTVSKYMENKISRLDEARFGVWRVKRTEHSVETCGTDTGITVNPQCGSEVPVGIREKAGTSRSSESLPPLKLILRKSLAGDKPEEPLPQEKPPRRKYKTKTRKSEPKSQTERRKPGRPSTNSNKSTKQKLMKLLKKKYFKDRKRWSRMNSTSSMPPTIRSIAKP